jgi:hypothetical protein
LELRVRSLPPPTERLWHLLQHAAELDGFVLIGGTALAMRINHRVSEDLDFIQAQAGRLARGKIRAMRMRLEALNWILRENPSPALLLEYEDSGLAWEDFQQDFIADDPAGGSVKLTFVAAEPENLRSLAQVAGPSGGGPRVAGMGELFRLKCMAAADRSKSRDWLDLYLLFQSGQFSAGDFIDAFENAGVPQKLYIALMRMTSGKLPSTDEGFMSLMETPPDMTQMREHFAGLADEVEQLLAARQFASGPPQV